MQHCKVFFLLTFLLSSSAAFSQDLKSYENAQKLAQEATTEIKSGNFEKADSLIWKSLESYPTIAIFDYAAERALLFDIKGANDLMFDAIKKVEDFPDTEIFAVSPFSPTVKHGKLEFNVEKFPKSRAVLFFSIKAQEVNRGLGYRKYLLKSYRKISETEPVTPLEDQEYDMEYALLNSLQKTSRIGYEIMLGNYEAATVLLNSLKDSDFGSAEMKINFQLQLLLASGSFNEYRKLLEVYRENPIYKGIYKMSLFESYAREGEAAKAEDLFNSLSKTEKNYGIRGNNNMFSSLLHYNLGLVDLAKKDFKKARDNFKTSIKAHQTKGTFTGLNSIPWEVYTGLAEANLGLQNFEQAKDNFRIALMYHPDYQPAVDGLTRLEVQYATALGNDVVPPVITITEPKSHRGSIVITSGKNILIRGIASDPSGIKKVVINGQSVYSSSKGDFWGEVSIPPGPHPIAVVATDIAGNTAEMTLEIQYSQSENNVVVEKEGENYILLVAAQNYTDRAIPSLDKPISDALRLKLLLKTHYGYKEENIIPLFNPSAVDLKRQLMELRNILLPEDNIIIFYAGHGIWKEKEKKGYWLMTDAQRQDASSWVSNEEVLKHISEFVSRNVLLITDACFSGSVFKTRGLNSPATGYLQELNNKISRVAITSGNDSEVPDESIFMKYLVKALNENKEKQLTAQKMFINQILEAVMTETDTEPRYGTLETAGHIGGDFIFTKK